MTSRSSCAAGSVCTSFPNTKAAPARSRRSRSIPRLEQWLGGKVHRTPSEIGLALDPATGRHLLEELGRRAGDLVKQGLPAVLVVSSEVRLPIKRFFEPSLPRLVVLGFQELPPATEIENTGIVPRAGASVAPARTRAQGRLNPRSRPSRARLPSSSYAACYRFVVASADEAARLIREKLGAEARVLSVRAVGQNGWRGWLGKSRLEVIAQVSEPSRSR